MYKRMLGIERLGRALRIGRRADLVVEDVPPVAHLAGRALAANDDDLLERLQISHHLVDAILHRRGLALARGAVDGDQDLRRRELHPLAHGLGGEAAEDDVVRSADPRAGEHRDDDLGDHRQVDPDHVALLHAEILQRAGEALDLGEQLGVGDVALGAVLAAPVKRDALAPPRLDVPVEAVVGDVQRAAGEPLVERRIGVVEHRVPLLKPVQPLGLLDPPAPAGRAPPARRPRGLSAARARETPRAGRTSRHRAAPRAPGRAPRRWTTPIRSPSPDPNARSTGYTGRTVRPKVEFVTAANDAYQAAAAVARPR